MLQNPKKKTNNLLATLMASCMVRTTFLIAELHLRVSVEIINKITKISLKIVVMSLSDNVNYMVYSAILKKLLKSIGPELERTSFYEKLNHLACLWQRRIFLRLKS